MQVYNRSVLFISTKKMFTSKTKADMNLIKRGKIRERTLKAQASRNTLELAVITR